MNKKPSLQKVNFGTFAEQDNVEYSDGDLVLITNIADLTRGNSTKAYQLELVAMVFCTQGKAQVRINGQEYSVQKDNMMIITPMSIVEDLMISPDFVCYALGLSYNSIQHTMSAVAGRRMWDIRTYLVKNPVISLGEDGQQVGKAYKELLTLKLKYKNETFYKEIMHSLFDCLFYELASMIQPMVDDAPLDEGVKQGDLLCKRFLELIAKNEGRERSVAFYADKLCVTPKYLSTVTKEASGKTALEWIHLNAIESIKRQLKYTDKTIKEIAESMNFPNLSFFGKFVRTHAGMSPTEFRKHIYDNGTKDEGVKVSKSIVE